MAETNDRDTTDPGDTTDQPDKADKTAARENDNTELDVPDTGVPIADAPEVSDADAKVSGLEPTEVVGTGRPWKRHVGVGLLAAVYVGAFGLAGFLGWKLWEQHTLTEAVQNARETATSYAEVLTSIDSNNLDENFADVLNGATGDFKDMYTRDSVELRQLLVDNKATAHGVVVDSALQSESKDKVVVLLLVDQTVTNTARPDARSDSSRMKITMEKVDNRWLASQVELP